MDSTAFDIGTAIGEALSYVALGLGALIVVALIFSALYLANRYRNRGPR